MKPERHTLRAPTWLRPDAVFIEEAGPMIEVHRAVRQRDEVALWGGYRTARNQEAYIDWIASAVGGRVTEGNGRLDHLHETLIGIPFLLPAGSLTTVGLELGWVVDEQQLRERLVRWLPTGHSIVLNNCLIPYSHLGSWSPLRQQDVLSALARQEAVEAHATERAVVREELPQLLFVLASLRRRLEEPEVPESGGEAELHLRQAIAAQLGYALGQALPVESVLAPMQFTAAVQAGLSGWLDWLLSTGMAESWTVIPRGEDMMQLELRDHAGELLAAVLIRLHQLESRGFELLTLSLAEKLKHTDADGQGRGVPSLVA